jgi:ABC-type siderophore export system fused ATPase/permease subunit
MVIGQIHTCFPFLLFWALIILYLIRSLITSLKTNNYKPFTIYNMKNQIKKRLVHLHIVVQLHTNVKLHMLIFICDYMKGSGSITIHIDRNSHTIV